MAVYIYFFTDSFIFIIFIFPSEHLDYELVLSFRVSNSRMTQFLIPAHLPLLTLSLLLSPSYFCSPYQPPPIPPSTSIVMHDVTVCRESQGRRLKVMSSPR